LPLAAALVAALAIGACGDDEPALTRDRACQEAALTWCGYVKGGTGCWYAYEFTCALPDPTTLIRQLAQDACLDAMAAIAPGLPACDPEAGDCLAAVPAACTALWSPR
jgi:hypothetical protein